VCVYAAFQTVEGFKLILRCLYGCAVAAVDGVSYEVYDLAACQGVIYVLVLGVEQCSYGMSG
jgi:hypothetical protein